MAWQNPKTDWAVNPKNPVPEDFNRIEGNIDFLKGDIETKKGAIVNALNTVGLASELTDTHAELAGKITAANQGAINKTITTQNGQVTIEKGFHNGSGIVKADILNLVTGNIKKGANVGGVIGTYNDMVFSPGDIIQAESPQSSWSNSDYTKRKEILVAKPGTYRISFRITGSSSSPSYAYIAVNGVKVGIERTNITSTTTFTEDITVNNSNSLIQLYVKRDGTASHTIYFFRVQTTEAVIFKVNM